MDKPKKDPLAVELGRRGGLKGGKARAAKLAAEERSESARKAARARWARERAERVGETSSWRSTQFVDLKGEGWL